MFRRVFPNTHSPSAGPVSLCLDLSLDSSKRLFNALVSTYMSKVCHGARAAKESNETIQTQL